MDLTALQNLIQNSYLLSDAQRSYWVQQLPLMRPEQKTKLEKILAGSDALPFQKQLEDYLAVLVQSAAKLAGQTSANAS